MFNVLRQPYPFDEPASRSWWRAVLIGLFVGLFLLAFQPFGLDRWQTPGKAAKVMGFGLISFAITAFNFLAWPRLFPRIFNEETWTVGKAILFITINILLIAVANRLYVAWLLDEDVHDLFSMIVITFLVGVFPTAGAIIASYVLKLRQYASQAADLLVHPPQSIPEPTAPPAGDVVNSTSTPMVTLTLVADNEKDQLTFASADLLYIESSDNYCTVVYLTDGQPVKPLLRSSLSRLERQIPRPYADRQPFVRKPFVRCHRSYVVNLDRVERVTGNAQGYRLHLLNGQFTVPVSRQYNDTLVAELKGV